MGVLHNLLATNCSSYPFVDCTKPDFLASDLLLGVLLVLLLYSQNRKMGANYSAETTQVKTYIGFEIGCKVYLDENEPFQTGGVRKAFKGKFYGTGEYHNRVAVVKVFIDPTLRHDANIFSVDFKTNTFFASVVDAFNEHISLDKKVSFRRPMHAQIKHVPTRGVFLLSRIFYWDQENATKHFDRQTNVFIEEFLEGEFVKFISNNGWVSKNCPSTPPALAHFSWVKSKGDYLVCDIQGVRSSDKYELSDPAVHSIDQRFGTTDLGLIGMFMFFSTHVCNDLCRSLRIDVCLPSRMTKLPSIPTTKNTSFTNAITVSKEQYARWKAFYEQNVLKRANWIY